MPITVTQRMTLLLDETSLAKLNELARRAQISKCAILRQLISHRAAMELNLTPTCANGHRCSCPQMHGVAPSIPHVDDSFPNASHI